MMKQITTLASVTSSVASGFFMRLWRAHSDCDEGSDADNVSQSSVMQAQSCILAGCLLYLQRPNDASTLRGCSLPKYNEVVGMLSLALGIHRPFVSPSPQLFESKHSLLFDYCSNYFWRVHIFQCGNLVGQHNIF